MIQNLNKARREGTLIDKLPDDVEEDIKEQEKKLF